MSRRVRVALLDSGVFAQHPHIQRPIVGGVTILPSGDEPGFQDTLGHGTAVCALVQHMAPDADVFAVKIFDRQLATSLGTVLRALDWCVKQQIDIINLSLGTTNAGHAPAFLEAIAKVRTAGSTLVSAFEADGQVMLPGSLAGVIGAVMDPDCPREHCRVRRLAGTAFAACPYPRDIEGVPRERNLRGVSFSVAHVTAQIARMWPSAPPHADWTALLAADGS
ncbi:hypothetical protein BH10ACI4_BH10ACI4_35570 [soil metagenome]